MVNTVYWFRKALRLHDNPSLVKAIEGSAHVHPVFCLDPHFTSGGYVGANRMNFLLETLTDLDESLTKMGSRLIVLQGAPGVELKKCFEAWGIQRLAFESDTEPYAVTRDKAIVDMAKAAGLEVVTQVGGISQPPAAVFLLALITLVALRMSLTSDSFHHRLDTLCATQKCS